MSKLIDRLREQLQNCVNHLERAKRRWPHGNAEFEAAIVSANKALYESLYSDHLTRADIPEALVDELKRKWENDLLEKLEGESCQSLVRSLLERNTGG